VGLLRSEFVRLARSGDTSMLPPGADWCSLMAQAISEGVGYLRERLGEDMEAWSWGRLHFTQPRHTLSEAFPELAPLLDPPSMPISGDGDTPHQGSYSLARPFSPDTVSVARYVFDPADWDNSAWVIPLGASGHPGSTHYADQAPAWADVRLIPMLYDWGRIEASAESRQELERG
jgi:penicillin amidase